MAYSEVNVKASAITGGIIGFLCWLLIIPYGYSNYGMMGYMMGNPFHASSGLSVILDLVVGGVFGAVLALVYNWALKIK